MFKVNFDGRIGRDARVITTDTGRFMSFTVATNRKIRKNEYATYWLDVTTNDEKHIRLAEYLKKGTPVCIGGDLTPVKQTGQDGQDRYVLRVNADYVTFPMFANKNQDGQQEGATAHQTSRVSTQTSVEDEIRMNSAVPIQQAHETATVGATVAATADDDLPF